MFGNFQENFRSTEMKPTEFDVQDHSKDVIPSTSDLKAELEDIFHVGHQETAESGIDMPIEKSWQEKETGLVTLEDGTIVKLPEEIQGDIAQKIDDNGTIYMQDGERKPNITYELNGNVYTTDSLGRIVHFDATPQRSPENPRDIDAQIQAGDGDRRPNDQGGHLVGRDLNGDGGAGNLIAMDSRINLSDYKRMENDIKSALDDQKEVTMQADITYEGDSKRPDKIVVTVTIDGKDTVYKFDNNIEGSLMSEVPENGKEAVQAELKDTQGEITSIKADYDENGNLTRTTVNITYADTDGTNHRTRVVIENN